MMHIIVMGPIHYFSR